ncbi:hypothetical protein AWZ03_009556 [Drosophila navojoa]|uniref:Uncharacterized protein n=1 Tax=Drosophila navojoa TaxID=7232 RepID=A0A484B570_DRONA|nr:hypothetical protein AWZ03_009556 [Drosophila navojoa]
MELSLDTEHKLEQEASLELVVKLDMAYSLGTKLNLDMAVNLESDSKELEVVSLGTLCSRAVNLVLVVVHSQELLEAILANLVLLDRPESAVVNQDMVLSLDMAFSLVLGHKSEGALDNQELPAVSQAMELSLE